MQIHDVEIALRVSWFLFSIPLALRLGMDGMSIGMLCRVHRGPRQLPWWLISRLPFEYYTRLCAIAEATKVTATHNSMLKALGVLEKKSMTQ